MPHCPCSCLKFQTLQAEDRLPRKPTYSEEGPFAGLRNIKFLDGWALQSRSRRIEGTRFSRAWKQNKIPRETSQMAPTLWIESSFSHQGTFLRLCFFASKEIKKNPGKGWLFLISFPSGRSKKRRGKLHLSKRKRTENHLITGFRWGPKNPGREGCVMKRTQGSARLEESGRRSGN